jgi:hypothetical protein
MPERELEYIKELRDAIRRLHGAEAKHVQSVLVKEKFQDEIVWDGVVEVFDIVGHPKANRVYAWAHNASDNSGTETKRLRRQIAVLHIPPVISPETAVRAAIIEEYKNLGTA